MNELVIAPSVLSMDYSKMTEQLNELNTSKAKWIHFDVMDGHFVPNITFGSDILKGFHKGSSLYLDVHLMITDPDTYAPDFIKAGANMITFHTEALNNDKEAIKALISKIKGLGCDAGIVVKPKTAIEQFEELLPLLDMVLVMSVEPGFGGQSFMEDQLDKVRWLKAKREELNLNYRIEIDGGINEKTAVLAKEAGCDTLVAGSYVFKNNIHEAIEAIL